MEEKQIIKKELPDSIELGTPKIGVMKVYFDASNLDDAKLRIDNAAKALNYALSVKTEVKINEN